MVCWSSALAFGAEVIIDGGWLAYNNNRAAEMQREEEQQLRHLTFICIRRHRKQIWGEGKERSNPRSENVVLKVFEFIIFIHKYIPASSPSSTILTVRLPLPLLCVAALTG